MPRAFPVLYAGDVEQTATFYERLGFERHFQLPPEGPAGYVGLDRGGSELAVVERQWPIDHYGITPGDAPTSETFIYVDDVDAVVATLEAAGVSVIRPPAEMPWGERVGFVLDPDGRPVALAQG